MLTSHTQDCIVKAMVFPIVMYGCESWTIKKAELQRVDAFELWCWRILLRVPWTTKNSNQSVLKEINPEYSLEGLMLMLQYYATISFAIYLTDNYLYVRKIMWFFFLSLILEQLQMHRKFSEKAQRDPVYSVPSFSCC